MICNWFVWIMKSLWKLKPHVQADILGPKPGRSASQILSHQVPASPKPVRVMDFTAASWRHWIPALFPLLPLQGLQQFLPVHDACVWVHCRQNAPGHRDPQSIIHGTQWPRPSPPPPGQRPKHLTWNKPSPSSAPCLQYEAHSTNPRGQDTKFTGARLSSQTAWWLTPKMTDRTSVLRGHTPSWPPSLRLGCVSSFTWN